MNITASLVLLFVAVIFVLAAALGISFFNRNKRSKDLKEKFGPEYDLAMENAGGKRKAEATLNDREKRVAKLDVRELNESESSRYIGEWTKIQADFVDDPSKAVEEANRLITEVMIARGFPVTDFEQRAADISVSYPDFVSNYRNANTIAVKNKADGATTEQLRQAMVYYHSLFTKLLGSMDTSKA